MKGTKVGVIYFKRISKSSHKRPFLKHFCSFEYMDLNQEGERTNEMLKGKVVSKVMRERAKEICIEFTDGTRLFVDHQLDNLEISITGESE